LGPPNHVYDNLPQTLLTEARRVIVAQLQLLDLRIRTEKVAVPMDGTTRAHLIDLMASILTAVFHAEGGVDDRGSVQFQGQAGTLGAQSDRCVSSKTSR
jgi:hypothetical protein